MAEISLSRSQMLLLSGTANRGLAEEVAQHLGQPLCALTIKRFADGELFVKIDENVRGRDVYIIQSTNQPAENMMELLLLMDAAKRASAARVTAVIPYFGYARQDRKDQPRVAISAKLMANMVSKAGCEATSCPCRCEASSVMTRPLVWAFKSSQYDLDSAALARSMMRESHDGNCTPL